MSLFVTKDAHIFNCALSFAFKLKKLYINFYHISLIFILDAVT